MQDNIRNTTYTLEKSDPQHENTKKVITITQDDLPLRCPMPDMLIWNAHPRVFLEIEKEPDGTIICPYCSTKYVLK